MTKRFSILGVLCVFLVAGAAFAGSGDGDEPLAEGQARVVIPVTGMTCGGCCVPVESAVNKLEGVVNAKADYDKGRATVVYEESKVTVKEIVDAINTTSFKASMPEKKDS